LSLFSSLNTVIETIKQEQFTPNIVYQKEEPIEFSSIPLTIYQDLEHTNYSSISKVLETYYSSKNKITRIRQKSADLRKVVTNALERTSKKYDLQLRQLKDTEKRDKYRVYGELINTYGYGLEPEAKSLTCLNYYTNEEITIPLDSTLSPQENSKRYFAKYNKLKRTYEALTDLIVETKSELDHLESIYNSLDIALLESDLVQLKQELMEYGYMKRRYNGGKKEKITSKPFHYISSDGFHMYVGKNNYQNEELTFKFANGNDWWFHAKGMAGSHVIVKREQGQELPDRTFEEAGRLAGYYSKGRTAPKVEIDYTERKNLKKPPAAKPGFVIYHTNYSLLIEPDISMLRLVEDEK
ncbi:MAG: NFACT family protein, partial [Firmicutes bacterium]|nr:NFACT family protein [Candidatus Scybalomonas excrementavium]